MNVGLESGLQVQDVISAIQGHTGLPTSAVGLVDIRERHTFVDVASEHVHSIVSKLKRAQVKNQNLKVKVA